MCGELSPVILGEAITEEHILGGDVSHPCEQLLIAKRLASAKQQVQPVPISPGVLPDLISSNVVVFQSRTRRLRCELHLRSFMILDIEVFGKFRAHRFAIPD